MVRELLPLDTCLALTSKRCEGVVTTPDIEGAVEPGTQGCCGSVTGSWVGTASSMALNKSSVELVSWSDGTRLLFSVSVEHMLYAVETNTSTLHPRSLV